MLKFVEHLGLFEDKSGSLMIHTIFQSLPLHSNKGRYMTIFIF